MSQVNDKLEEPPEKKQSVPLKTRIFRYLDLFSFLPTPKTDPISSERSIQGSILMITLFSSYIIFTFLGFITQNSPMVNQYDDLLPIQSILMPNIAFAYFFGDPFAYTVNDPTIFKFTYYQATKYQNITEKDSKIIIDLEPCNPDWLPMSNFTLLCPKIQAAMVGALYSNNAFIYPSIEVTYCKPTDGIVCASQEEIYKIAGGGRILLYIQDDTINFNMRTGERKPNLEYQVFEYFLMPGFYPRAEIYFLKSLYVMYPDFFRRFLTETIEYVSFESYTTWLTNVSYYNPIDGYEIYFRMDQYQQKTYLNYMTSINLISLWGAFFSILFSAFATYFLAYNQDNFYSENHDWDNFGHKIGVKKPKDTLHWEEDDHDHHHKDKFIIGEKKEIEL